MAEFEIKTQGTSDLVNKMLSLSGEVVDNIIKKAFNKVGQDISKTAKSIVRKRSKALAKSLGYKRKIYQKTTIVLIIGPKKGSIVEYKGQKLNPAKYAHLVEYGHRIVPKGSGKTSREARANLTAARKQGSRLREGQALGKLASVTSGSVAPMPFLRPAYEQYKTKIEDTIKQSINDAIDKIKTK